MNDSQRIDELEVKAAFLEEALNKLSNEYYQQQLIINQLQAQQQLMLHKMQELKQADPLPVDYVDDKPPHY